MITARYHAMSINATTLHFPDIQLILKRHIIHVNGILLAEAKIPGRHFVESITTLDQRPRFHGHTKTINLLISKK
jgi:hypothetical protein